MSKQAIYNYDVLGRLQEVQFSTGGRITYSYDTMGNRTSVVEVAAGCCLEWKGAWSNSSNYIVGDAVTSGGSSYICTADNTNQQPPNASFWDVLAQKGDTGAQGPQGIQGNQGPQGIQGPQGNQGTAGQDGATGAKGLNWKGTWSSSTAYVVDDAVTLNGTSYVAVANNTNSSPPSANWNTLAAKGDQGIQGPQGNQGAQGQTGQTGATGAKGLNWKGTWSSSTSYVVDDAVTLNGTSYVAVANNTNSTPPSANWNTLAAKGDQGATGPQGPAGADGSNTTRAKVKIGTSTKTSDATLADDPTLHVAVDANQTYSFELNLIFESTNNNTDAKIALVGPSGSTISFFSYSSNASPSGPTSGSTAKTLDVGNNLRAYKIVGSIVVAGTAGNLTLQWAQSVSRTTALALHLNSSLLAIQN